MESESESGGGVLTIQVGVDGVQILDFVKQKNGWA